MPARKFGMTGIGLLFTLHLAACADMGFPNSWELGGLRVLALQVDRPEVNLTLDPQVTITPYISDIDGAGRPLEYVIQACYDPAVLFGADPDCTNHLESLLGPVETRTGTLGLPVANATGVATPAVAGDFTFTLPVALLALFDPVDNAVELNNGIPYSILFTLTDPATGETVTSFRRVSVTSRTSLNQNPAFLGVFNGDGAAVSSIAAGSEDLEVKADATEASTETYIALSRDGSSSNLTEELSVSWFTNAGEFASGRTEPGGFVTYTPPTVEQVASAEEAAPYFWVFLRDDRGGVSALEIPTAVVR